MGVRTVEGYPGSLWETVRRLRPSHRFDLDMVESGDVEIQIGLPREVWAVLDADAMECEDDYSPYWERWGKR